MSKQTLDLLRAVSLLNKDGSAVDLSKRPDDELLRILNYYYEKRAESADALISSLAAASLRNSAFLSTVSAENAPEALGSKLLVQSAIVVDDPVFDFASPEHKFTKVQKQALGMISRRLDREELSRKLGYFSTLAPFIEAGFLHVLPISLLHKTPENIPFNFPRNLYRERVPPGAVTFVNHSVIIRPMERTPEGLIVLPEPNVQRKRNVCLTFTNDDAATGSSFYQFHDVKLHRTTSEDVIKFEFEAWSDEPLDQARYDTWIEQITNQTVGARLQAIAKEITLSEYIGVPYVTESSFEANLLALGGNVDRVDPVNAVNFLQANTNLLNLIDLNAILQLRTNKAALFDRFRLSLSAAAEQLKGLPPSQFDERARQFFETEIQPQIAEINRAIGRIESAAAKGLVQTGAALVLALLNGAALPVSAWLSLTAAGTATEALPAIGDYLRLRKQPQFIWYRLSR
jgi:hypothetical protein